MKITFSRILIASGIFLCLNSCREEAFISDKAGNASNIGDANVKNGRLYFPNKESLKAKYEELKSVSDKDIISYVDNKNFESLRPVITEENAAQVVETIKERKISLSVNNSLAGKGVAQNPSTIAVEDVLTDLDDLEEIIGDDAYSAMLNGEAEIQVADKIYKYTDVGLFITPATKYDVLVNYLEVNSISRNLLEPTDALVAKDFIESMPSEKLVTITTDVEYFNANRIAPDEPDSGGGGGGGPYYPPSNPPVQEDIAQIIEGLKIGEIRTPRLGNIFGTTWVTDDKYEDRRRVKVKFYSQDLWLVYAIGCKVKHQYRGWTGTWRKENADKLGMGVNSISWSFTHTYDPPLGGLPGQRYFFEDKVFTTVDQYYNYVNMGPAKMPSLPFEKKIDGVIEWVYNVPSLTPEKLRKLFYEQAWKQVKKLGEKHNKKYNRVAFVVDTYTFTYVDYYDFSEIKDNQDVLEKVFDWGAVTPQITYTFGGGVGNGLSITKRDFDFKHPTAMGVNMYGIAKKNGGWHGAKLIKEKE
ncbi:MAG: hypothetical protein J6O88_18045 [Chryseobacterium sp.]|uniref:hypothetical protein n=1 Tax=Chryseobacterium sp. TaxID=1871047 RepID=UPI001B0182EB|nr:hypothetical protein [Chryseobacterium sp.]MBO6186562.1 hypothetical protein [Chryseobacterium sp.]